MLKLTGAAICLNINEFMAYRPRIGLTMRLEYETRRFYLGRDYSEAIEAAGGLPVHIPLIPDKDFIKTLIGQLDGVLLPGCDSDMDPAYYGEEPHPKLRKVVPEKDETDLLVLAEADRLELPILAICYGMQALNVFRGGTLIQDIGAQVENSLQHQQVGNLERSSHSISLAVGSILSELAGGDGVKVKVNSHHHQAVNKTGCELEVVARANDGIIEGIVDTRPERFVLGLQWHPELSWNSDAFSKRIFESFVTECSDRKTETPSGTSGHRA